MMSIDAVMDSENNVDGVYSSGTVTTGFTPPSVSVVSAVENENPTDHHRKNSNKDNCNDDTLVSSPSLSDSKRYDERKEEKRTNDMYQYLVLDSGPIIKRFYSSSSAITATGATSVSRIWEKAQQIFTVPAVINEIRDANARQYLQSLPFDIILQEPKSTSVQHIIQFAKQTGDYHSLSHTDLQVLALLYELEMLGCNGNISHIRTTPKRKLGLGKIQSLNETNLSSDRNHIPTDAIGVTTTKNTESDTAVAVAATTINIDVEDTAANKATIMIDENDYIVEVEDFDDDVVDEDTEGANYDDDDDDDDDGVERDHTHDIGQTPNNACSHSSSTTTQRQPESKSWASLLRSANSATPVVATTTDGNDISMAATNISQQPTLVQSRVYTDNNKNNNNDENISDVGGQFSDASEDGNDNDNDWSDEEDEANEQNTNTDDNLEKELRSDFPSLAASLLIPYDDEIEGNNDSATVETTASEERKLKSLQPISKSGKLYNSFTKYKDLMKSKPTSSLKLTLSTPLDEAQSTSVTTFANENGEEEVIHNYSSRIIGSGGNAGQMEDDFEDDGEGWITTTKDITKMKAAGALDPSRTVNDVNTVSTNNINNSGPMLCQRAACVTTDFAMQNVILQMNLELLSLDGIRVRKLKNWVTRCGACYTVYTNTDTNNVVGPLGKRLFCEKCGSDLMQRIAASVDGKTGRLRLHLSKKYQYNLRGTKFSLPKPGTNNRFQGDLLLREDQLLMGAWNQKLKMISGGKARDAAQSIFGRDIATNVGCHANSINLDDIRVGFGRRNPNAVKGRERRGKKKKSVNTACGLRRY